MKNKYAKRARISAAKIREVVHYFAIDLTALQAAALSGLNRNTVNRLYRALRERMLLACEAQRPGGHPDVRADTVPLDPGDDRLIRFSLARRLTDRS